MNRLPTETHPTACFSVQVQAHPQAMPRVLGLFAKRGLVPATWHSVTAGPDNDELHIDIQVADMARDKADYIARCLRQIVGVEAVLTSEKRRAESA